MPLGKFNAVGLIERLCPCQTSAIVDDQYIGRARRIAERVHCWHADSLKWDTILVAGLRSEGQQASFSDLM